LHDNNIYRFMKPKSAIITKYNLNKNFIYDALKTSNVEHIANHYGCTKSNIYVFCKKHDIKIPEIDLVGKEFNMLKVLEKIGSRGKSGRQSIFWKCLCSCGKTVELSTASIKREKQISCGCWIKSKDYREKSWCWSGCGDIHGKWWSNVKKGAKQRGHDFKISIEYAWKLFLKQNRRCALTGIEIAFGRSMKEIEKGATTASLDRIDNELGYVKKNIHWVHKDINLMKQGFSLDHFINMCNLVSKRQPCQNGS